MKTAKHTSILIVDDDVDIGNMLKLVFERKGFVATFLEIPDEVKERMKRDSIDLLILDMFLSGSNGTEICAEIKKDPLIAHIPVIMMSAHPDAKKTCLNAGADDFIPKPFELQDMFSKIHDHISKNKAAG